MTMDSTPVRGREIVRKAAGRRAQERAAFEEQLETRYQQLLTGFAKQWGDALGTMQADMDRVTSSVQTRAWTLWLFTGMAGLMLTLGIAAGTAVWLDWQMGRIVEAERTLAELQDAIRELGTGVQMTQAIAEWRYVVTNPGAPQPEVYQSDHYPGSWIIKLKR